MPVPYGTALQDLPDRAEEPEVREFLYLSHREDKVSIEVVRHTSPRVPPLPLLLVVRKHVNRMLGLLPDGEVTLVLLRVEPSGSNAVSGQASRAGR
jgi:hypothetical protein